MSKTVLFQTIQCSISTQFRSILPIDRTLPGVTTPGMSGPGSYGNKGHSLEWSYPSAEMHTVYSTAPANLAKEFCRYSCYIGSIMSLCFTGFLELSEFGLQSSYIHFLPKTFV